MDVIERGWLSSSSSSSTSVPSVGLGRRSEGKALEKCLIAAPGENRDSSSCGALLLGSNVNAPSSSSYLQKGGGADGREIGKKKK